MTRGTSLNYDHRNNVSIWERPDGTLHFRRDALDRLRAIDGLCAPWTADYDPLGRRTRKSFGSDSTEYYWDTDRLAAELHSDGRLRIYIYVDDFALTPWLLIDYHALDADPASGQLHYLLTDQRGAPVAALDARGRRVWTADLAPYGRATLHGHLDIPHRLPGQLHDPETGLHYHRFRYYSPDLARYLEEDPAGTGGGLNLYAYTTCPLVQFDPRGLATCKTCKADHSTESCPCTKDPRPRSTPRTPHRGSTCDEAALNALIAANEKSVRKNKEYGGLIYEKNGKFYATIPVSGTETGFVPRAAMPQVPSGARIVGDYHTHGDYSIIDSKDRIHRTSDPQRDHFNADEFSPRDREVTRIARRKNPHHRAYLGTPGGRYRVDAPEGEYDL